jgi:hypothetical protein
MLEEAKAEFARAAQLVLVDADIPRPGRAAIEPAFFVPTGMTALGAKRRPSTRAWIVTGDRKSDRD